MALFRLLRMVSRLLGRQRNLLRRFGGLLLLWMGIHAAADVLDDLAADLLDVVDLLADDAAAALLAGLSSHGLLGADTAARAIDGFGTLVDLDEKQWLALRLALLLELALDVLVLDLAWGVRAPRGSSRLDELRMTTKQLVESYSTIDLERVFAPVVLAMFLLSGALLAGTSLEQLARGALGAIEADSELAGSLSAVVAVVVVAVLVWRFLPDLLHGALLRAHERGERAREAIAARRARHPARWSTVALSVDEFVRARRGWWWPVVGAIAMTGLSEFPTAALVERLWGAP